MGFYKTQYMGDAIKSCCGIIAQLLTPENIFVPGRIFADGSTQEYSSRIVADGGAADHFGKIRDFLKAQRDDGPAQEEANALLSQLFVLENLQEDAATLAASQKENGKYDQNDDAIVRNIGDHISKLSSFCRNLDEFNRKTGFAHFDKKEMTSLMLIEAKIDEVLQEYQVGSLENAAADAARMELYAKKIVGKIDETKNSYTRLKELTDKTFFPEEADDIRQDAENNISELTKESAELVKKMNSLDDRIGEMNDSIGSDSSVLSGMKPKLQQQEADLGVAKKALQQATDFAQKAYRKEENRVDTATGKEFAVKSVTVDADFAQSLSGKNAKELEALLIETNGKYLRESERISPTKRQHYQSEETYFKGMAKDPSEKELSMYGAFLLLANGKKLQGPDAEAIGRSYARIRTAYDEIYPVKDTRGTVSKTFSSFFGGTEHLSGLEDKLRSIEAAARKESEAFRKEKEIFNEVSSIEYQLGLMLRNGDEIAKAKARIVKAGREKDIAGKTDAQILSLECYGKINPNWKLTDEKLKVYRAFREKNETRTAEQVYTDLLNKSFGELFLDLGNKYEEKKLALPGVREAQKLQAEISAINQASEALKKQDALKKNNEEIAKLNEVIPRLEAKYQPEKKEYDALTDAVRKKAETLEELKSEHRAAELSSVENSNEIKKNKAVIRTCREISVKCDELQKQAKETTEKLGAFLDVYPKTLPTDERRKEVVQSVNDFCEHIMDNKGIRSNSSYFTAMATALTDLQTVLRNEDWTKQDLEEGCAALSAAADKYLEEKSKQTMVLGTTRRGFRNMFAARLKNWADKTPGKMNREIPQPEAGENIGKLANTSEKDIPTPESLKKEYDYEYYQERQDEREEVVQKHINAVRDNVKITPLDTYVPKYSRKGPGRESVLNAGTKGKALV